MASFKTHISFGIALGVLGAMGVGVLGLSGAPSFMVTLFVLATLGSVLPDMDSDSSVPFHVAFGSLTIVTAVLVFNKRYSVEPLDWYAVIAWTALSAVFVWSIGYMFKRFTRHRGMAHSIPAVLLSGLIAFFLAAHLGYMDSEAFLLGVALSAGYLLHLILDELYAAVNFHGSMFVPNKAFGSALKLFSHSIPVNCLMVVALLFFLTGNAQRLWLLAKEFWKLFTIL